MNLLVVAYAFSPRLGSEFAQGWNYISRLACYNGVHVTVLVGSSDGAMGAFSFLEGISLPNVNIVEVEPDWLCKILNFLDRNLGVSWLFVLSLRRWNRIALARAEWGKNHDVFHHLGPVGFKTLSDVHLVEPPVYWGPVGGCQTIPVHLAFRSSFKYGFVALIRNYLTKRFLTGPFIRRRLQSVDVLSFATSENRDNFEAEYGLSGGVLSDQATVQQMPFELVDSKEEKSIVWVGSLDARKNVRLLTDIAILSKSMGKDFRFYIAGDGPLRSFLCHRIKKYSLDNLVYLGVLDRNDLNLVYSRSAIYLSTSLSEANTASFFEALQYYCIPIALNKDGFSNNIRNGIGLKVEVNAKYSKIVAAYVDALTECLSSLEIYQKNLQRAIPEYTWDSLCAAHHANLIKAAVK